MDTKVKNTIGWLLALALIVGSYAMFSYVRSYARMTMPSSIGFNVSGEGKAVAKPDVAKFSLTVINEGGADVGALQKANTEKVNKIIDFLGAQGIDKKDITTAGYQISPRYQYYGCNNGGVCPPSEIVGYTVSQTVDVKMRDFSKIGGTLAGVVKNGANSVSQLTFALDDPGKVKADARKVAIANAQAEAKRVADAAGISLGRLLSIDENNYPTPIAFGRGGAADMKSMTLESAPVAPNIQPGSQEVTVNVTLRYEIK